MLVLFWIKGKTILLQQVVTFLAANLPTTVQVLDTGRARTEVHSITTIIMKKIKIKECV